MRRRLLLLILVPAFMACTSNDGANAEQRKLEYAEYIDDPTSIEFDSKNFNFGETVDGDMVRHTYKFTNTGDRNLVLINVTGSCGCTVPENWPKYPIEPGGEGEIEVVFNSKSRVGNVTKNIRVEANTHPSLTTLTLRGKVLND